MHSAHKYILGLLFTLFSSYGLATDVRVAFGEDSAPFVLKGGGGLEVDIVRKALKKQGLTLVPIYLKTKHFKTALRLNRVDAISNMKRGDSGQASPHKFFMSDEYIHFKNYIVTKADSSCSVINMLSLTKCNVGAWVDARHQLEGKWQDYFSNSSTVLNKNYFEFSDQNAQIKMLMKDHIDALIIDENIFKYQYNILKKQFKDPMTFTHHKLFDNLNSLGLAFSNEQLRDDFNKGLKQLKKYGEYDQIFVKYLGKASPFQNMANNESNTAK